MKHPFLPQTNLHPFIIYIEWKLHLTFRTESSIPNPTTQKAKRWCDHHFHQPSPTGAKWGMDGKKGKPRGWSRERGSHQNGGKRRERLQVKKRGILGGAGSEEQKCPVPLWGFLTDTSIPHFTALHSASLYFADVAFFTNWGSAATLCQASLLAPFFQQDLLTSSLCHILIILTKFKTFSLLLYLLWWSVTFDNTIVIVVWYSEPHPHKMVNLITLCVFWLLQLLVISLALPLLGPSYSSGHNNCLINIRQINNHIMTSKSSCERKSCRSLTLSQKLEMIKLSEDSALKAELDQKHLHQTVKLWIQRKSS